MFPFYWPLNNVHLSTLNPERLQDPVNVMQFSELQKSWFLKRQFFGRVDCTATLVCICILNDYRRLQKMKEFVVFILF